MTSLRSTTPPPVPPRDWAQEGPRTDLAVPVEERGPVALDLEVVVPVYNEESTLEAGVTRLQAFLASGFPASWVITIVDNASTDRTWAVAERLSSALSGVRATHLDRKGRGLALRSAWSASEAAVVAYMDVDLSTDLSALSPLVAPLLSGHSDVAIGTRLARGARVVRGAKREVISRGYNLLLRLLLRVGFSDAQCGFKAMRADRARALLPAVEDDGWFFDTELLVLAERSGMRIHEVPVDWVDDPDSRVDILSTALEDLKGVFRVGWDLATGRIRLPQMVDEGFGAGRRSGLVGQMARFAVVGVLSTAFYFLIYLALRSVAPAQVSNATALLISAIANTAVNRRFTFGVKGRRGLVLHQSQGLVVFGVGLGLTSLSLGLLAAVMPDASRLAEVGALIVANGLATLVRFALFRGWIFRHTRIGIEERGVA